MGPYGSEQMILFVNLSVNDCLRVPAGAFSTSTNYSSKEFKTIGSLKNTPIYIKYIPWDIPWDISWDIP